jgi:hypothetical protein
MWNNTFSRWVKVGGFRTNTDWPNLLTQSGDLVPNLRPLFQRTPTSLQRPFFIKPLSLSLYQLQSPLDQFFFVYITTLYHVPDG